MHLTGATAKQSLPDSWAKVVRDRGLIHAALVILSVSVVTIGLFTRLGSFPGLHGDEAWMGLRALEQQARGMFTLRGMNGYTGSLFPEIVTMSFSILSPTVDSLRLPGAILNGLALLLMTAALWKRGAAAIYFVLLMGSSFLFVFYSRVAWEVNALQNFLLATIFLALTQSLSRSRSSPGWIFLFLIAFSVGCWNHAIFASAALSFAAAATLAALKWPSEDSVKLMLVGHLNLLLQAVLLVRHFVRDGPFTHHALPAIVAGLAAILAATRAYSSVEAYVVPAVLRVITDRRVARLASTLLLVSVALSLLVSRTSDVSFFGTVSGIILLERVVSYVPGPVEMTALHARMAIFLAGFAAIMFAGFRSAQLPREQPILPLLVLWTIFYFPALRLAIPTVADRYYIIPQFLFFCSIALAIDSYPLQWRAPLQLVVLAGFIHAQTTLFREIVRDKDRPPFETFKYGSYSDTSRHFLKLDPLTDYLKAHGLCEVRSSNFFITQPMHFLMMTGRPCLATGYVEVEYCKTCFAPVPWFELRTQ
jgi:hypothetical protein